jgi:hypothetical protein
VDRNDSDEEVAPLDVVDADGLDVVDDDGLDVVDDEDTYGVYVDDNDDEVDEVDEAAAASDNGTFAPVLVLLFCFWLTFRRCLFCTSSVG